ncbi:P-loop containing nucleoside triphosphate hydrolase protein [Trichoderma sp. SZMC 28012]
MTLTANMKIPPTQMDTNTTAIDAGPHPSPAAAPLDCQSIPRADGQFDRDLENKQAIKSSNFNEEFADKKSRHWYNNLCRHLADANGAVSETVLTFLFTSLGNTKMILVVGQAGTGKSTILEELTGLDLTVAGSLKSGTRTYQVCPAIIDGGQYLFVDTAGFGAADINDVENFGNIMACLYSLGMLMIPTGVMFVFGKVGTRFMEHDLKTVRWIECLCGPEFFQNITIVTSMWDRLVEEDFEEECQKIQELVDVPDIARILKPPGQYDGGVIYHHGLPKGKIEDAQYSSVMSKKRHGKQRSDALKDLIRDRYADCKRLKLQIMRDDINVISWTDTEAGKVLVAHQSEIEIKIFDDRAIVYNKSSDLVWMGNRERAMEMYETEEPQQDNEGSWPRIVYRWYEVVKSVSSYFDEAQKLRNEGIQRPPAWSLWGSLKNWFRRWFS